MAALYGVNVKKIGQEYDFRFEEFKKAFL